MDAHSYPHRQRGTEEIVESGLHGKSNAVSHGGRYTAGRNHNSPYTKGNLGCLSRLTEGLRGVVDPGYRNAMAYGDCVVSNQDVFHYAPHDPLSFNDTQGISSAAQAIEECSKGL